MNGKKNSNEISIKKNTDKRYRPIPPPIMNCRLNNSNLVLLLPLEAIINQPSERTNPTITYLG